jgi:pimeloyl-ACP methyl ester carboxylesterase
MDDDATLVFVHSPLVGPLTWRAVADRFTAAGRRTLLPDLTGAMAGPAPYLPRIAATVAEAADPAGAPVVLIGHSGAGPLLPGIASALGVPVRALVYVDAGLPYPGQTWFERAPADLVAHLRGLASGGSLPPWHEWFPADAVAGLLPDPPLRDRFTAELGPLPLDFFDEPMPAADWSGPAGYLLLSEAYRDDVTRAAGRGMPVVERLSDHLAMVTAPAPVTAALRELLAALDPPAGRTFEVCIDANDPQRLRPFWRTALDYVEQVTGEGAVDLVDPAERGPTVWFQRVPEAKTAKNRVHLDVRVTGGKRAELTERLVALGGSVLSTFPHFTVLADPEGNEVCLNDA